MPSQDVVRPKDGVELPDDLVILVGRREALLGEPIVENEAVFIQEIDDLQRPSFRFIVVEQQGV